MLLWRMQRWRVAGDLHRHSIVGLATLATSLVLIQAPSQAQPVSGLSVRGAVSAVVEQGYEPLSTPVRRGGNYVLDAVDEESGIEMRLVVDADSGDVISARPRGFATLPPEPQRPVPPARVPLPRSAAASADGGDRAPATLPPPARPAPRPAPTQSAAAPDKPARALPPVAPLKPLPASPTATVPATTDAPSGSSDMPSVQGFE